MTLTPGWLDSISRNKRNYCFWWRNVEKDYELDFFSTYIELEVPVWDLSGYIKQSWKCHLQLRRGCSRMWGVCYLPRWCEYSPMYSIANTLPKPWVMKMAIWWLLALVIVNTFQLSVKFQKSRTLRISKLWRQAKKEETSKGIERKSETLGNKKTIEFSQQRCNAVSFCGDHMRWEQKKRPLGHFL